MRRTLALFAVLLPACPIDGRPDDLTTIVTAGITVSGLESSTGDPEGDGPRLDLGDAPPLPDLPAEGTSTGSTGAADDSSGEAPGSTGELAGNTSTGEAGSSSSTGGSSSTGEPEPEPEPEPPSVCGDGVCEPAERSPCWSWTADDKWGPGFCAEDCMAAPECVAVLDCPCTPEAAAVKSWCFAEPLPACGATAPGGACSVSIPLAFFMWNAKCGG